MQTLSRASLADLLTGTHAPTSTLGRLSQIVGGLEIPELHGFVRSVFSDSAIALPFLRVPASIAHHHCHNVGLLEHSVECAEFVRDVMIPCSHERELAIVAALLHDIGKVMTFAPNQERTAVGTLIDHNALTLELLADHLHTLDRAWPDGGRALRYLWTWKARRRSSERPLMLSANIIQAADQISAAKDAWRQAYAGTQEWQQFARLEGFGPPSRFWVPKSPPLMTGETQIVMPEKRIIAA